MAFYAAHNKTRRFILVFSPKCGTRTCKQWFVESLLPHDRPRGQENLPAHEQLDAHLIEAESIVDPAHAYDRVAMAVRDPHRRLVSAYTDLFVGRPHEWGFTDPVGQVRVGNGTFRQVVESLVELHHRGIGLQHHLEPQVARITDLGRIDQFLRVDRLDQDLAALAHEVGHRAHRRVRIGTTTYVEPSVEPVTDRRPAWFRMFGFPAAESFYDRDLYDCVTDIYREDVELHRSLSGTRPLEPAW